MVTDTNGSHDDTASGGVSSRKWLPFPGRKLMSNDFVVTADQVYVNATIIEKAR